MSDTNDNGVPCKAKLVLRAEEPAAAAAFCASVLGWEPLGGDAYGENVGRLFGLPGGELALLVGGEGDLEGETERQLADPDAKRPASGERFYIRIAETFGSLDPIKERASAAGAVVKDELEPLCWRSLTIRLPDGQLAVYWQEFAATDEHILALYASGPDKLEAALAGLTEPDLDRAIAPGKWTIRQQTLHLVDLELAAAHKLKFILASAEPGRLYTSSRFEQDAWAEGMRYAERPIATEVALFRLLREHVRTVCRHIPDGLARSVTLASGQTETAGKLMKAMAGHANGHIRRIGEIREQAVDSR
ncbi:DinB family protein [Paenibacillus hodogayensis]|uniref:DinB family protein n=1 Tax=Paenibacillus hodogayensis TaxID=279208 RepID=A0ABV5VZN5_9BACL